MCGDNLKRIIFVLNRGKRLNCLLGSKKSTTPNNDYLTLITLKYDMDYENLYKSIVYCIKCVCRVKGRRSCRIAVWFDIGRHSTRFAHRNIIGRGPNIIKLRVTTPYLYIYDYV